MNLIWWLLLGLNLYQIIKTVGTTYNAIMRNRERFIFCIARCVFLVYKEYECVKNECVWMGLILNMSAYNEGMGGFMVGAVGSAKSHNG